MLTVVSFFLIAMLGECYNNISKLSFNNQCMINFRMEQKSLEYVFTSCRSYSNNLTGTVEVTDWKTCQKICCDLKSNNTHLKFDDCLTTSASQSILQAFFIPFILLITILTFIGLGYTFKKWYPSLEKRMNNNAAQQHQLKKWGEISKSTDQLIWIHSQNNCNQETSSSNQRMSEDMVSSLKKDVCVLCNNEKPDIHLFCGHIFHSSCLHISIQTRNQCEECPKYKINYVRLYCINCRCQYCILEVNIYKQLKGYSLYCSDCTSDRQSLNNIVSYYWVDSEQDKKSASIITNKK